MKCLGCEAEVKLPKKLEEDLGGVFCPDCSYMAGPAYCERCSGIPAYCEDCFEWAMESFREDLAIDDIEVLSLFIEVVLENLEPTGRLPVALGRLYGTLQRHMPSSQAKLKAQRTYLDSHTRSR